MSLELTELTERQRLFAEEFVKVPIEYKAAVKAGYSPDRAFITGSELVRNRKVRTYIKYLKELKRESLLIDKEDLIDVHMRIDFWDITDFVEFGRKRVAVLVRNTEKGNNEFCKHYMGCKVDIVSCINECEVGGIGEDRKDIKNSPT
ncbi:terminase small subunit [Clostridium sporogenes]|uniref:terminase small subunit n=1 Tax=Clostridium sporogenes TaxID=1509 RepID=UPI0022378059|nr:terminase small subunit [Clostridium sporogenes]MCW6091346.1 terminase small subunit [Clostridium sporogenes]